MIRVDFAENFSFKYSAEIHSVHFGSSHRQATMVYFMLWRISHWLVLVSVVFQTVCNTIQLRF